MWVVIESIPATFWGVIIGAFFSLSGVALTNRANDRRLHAQLAHDRQIKDRERELTLRKDVYLAAAEAISAGLMTVGRFADLEIPHDKLTEIYLEKSPAIAKVHVIAREKDGPRGRRLYGRIRQRLPAAICETHALGCSEESARPATGTDRRLRQGTRSNARSNDAI